MEEKLWDYIDGRLTEADKSFVEQLLANQEDWRNRYQELLLADSFMRDSVELDQPSLRFSQNVMEEITRYQITPAAKSYINKKLVYGIGSFFLVMVCGMLIYIFSQAQLTNVSATDALPEQFDLTKINFSKIFTGTFSNIFMAINVVMGLVLVDMWLSKKRKAMRENHHA